MDEAGPASRSAGLGTGLAFIIFPTVWLFAFAVHPNLLHPRLMLGPEALIWRAHGNGLLQFAHALVTVNTALLVVVTLHFRRLLEGTRAARIGTFGAGLATLGACMLAAEKGALCLTVSALDTLPEKQFDQMLPGLVAIFSFKGWMALTLGLVLMPLGVIVQVLGMWRVEALPRGQLILLLVSLLFIGFPDGAEIINCVAAIAMAIVMIPYGIRIIARRGRPLALPRRAQARPTSVG